MLKNRYGKRCARGSSTLTSALVGFTGVVVLGGLVSGVHAGHTGIRVSTVSTTLGSGLRLERGGADFGRRAKLAVAEHVGSEWVFEPWAIFVER